MTTLFVDEVKVKFARDNDYDAYVYIASKNIWEFALFFLIGGIIGIFASIIAPVGGNIAFSIITSTFSSFLVAYKTFLKADQQAKFEVEKLLNSFQEAVNQLNVKIQNDFQLKALFQGIENLKISVNFIGGTAFKSWRYIAFFKTGDGAGKETSISYNPMKLAALLYFAKNENNKDVIDLFLPTLQIFQYSPQFYYRIGNNWYKIPHNKLPVVEIEVIVKNKFLIKQDFYGTYLYVLSQNDTDYESIIEKINWWIGSIQKQPDKTFTKEQVENLIKETFGNYVNKRNNMQLLTTTDFSISHGHFGWFQKLPSNNSYTAKHYIVSTTLGSTTFKSYYYIFENVDFEIKYRYEIPVFSFNFIETYMIVNLFKQHLTRSIYAYEYIGGFLKLVEGKYYHNKIEDMEELLNNIKIKKVSQLYDIYLKSEIPIISNIKNLIAAITENQNEYYISFKPLPIKAILEIYDGDKLIDRISFLREKIPSLKHIKLQKHKTYILKAYAMDDNGLRGPETTTQFTYPEQNNNPNNPNVPIKPGPILLPKTEKDNKNTGEDNKNIFLFVLLAFLVFFALGEQK